MHGFVLSSLKVTAIPGLGTDPEYTRHEDKLHWLRDANMLPNKIPPADVYVFPYQSQ
jgi:hypothetical protein